MAHPVEQMLSIQGFLRKCSSTEYGECTGESVPPWLNPGVQDLLKDVAMAMQLILSAMAHYCDSPAFCQCLEQSERKFLPVVFDGAIAAVSGAAFKQLLPVTTAEFSPGYFSALPRVEQPFTRAEIGHPDMIPTGGHTAATKTSG